MRYSIGSAGSIVSLLNDSVKPILLLVAGASKQSGVKLVVEIVEEAAKWAYCKAEGIPIDDPRLTMSDWKKWLTKFPWYTEDYGTLYPIIVEELLNPRQARKDFFLKIINPGIPASKGYEVLAHLMHLGFIDTVLTTNFDNCLHHASIQVRKPPVIHQIKTPSDLPIFSYNPRYPQLVYLHGSVEHYTDQNLNEEIEVLNPNLVSTIRPILKDRPLVIIGYRGFEPSVMKSLFLDNLDYTHQFHQGIYWCLLRREVDKIHSDPNVTTTFFKELAQKTKGNFKVIPIDGFDEVMEREILGKLKANEIDIKANRISIEPSDRAVSPTYDSTIIANNTIGALEIALMRERIKNYSERLHIKVYDDEEWLYQQMLRLKVAEFTQTSTYELTRSGLLLFSSKTQQYLPQAKVMLRFIGKSDWLEKITSYASDNETSVEELNSGTIERSIEVIFGIS